MNRRTVTYEIPLIPGDKFYVPYTYFMKVSEYEVSRVIITRNSIQVEIEGNFDIGEEVTYNLDLLGKEILKDIVDYHFEDEYVTWLNHLFIDSTDGLGLPLGNQVAQIYALLMLNGLDKFVTSELGIQFYGRYMDDFYLIHHDKEYLKWCLECIREMVSSLNLSLNGKTQICPFKNGISFIGFHHYISKDGKYIRKLKSENKRKIRKKIRVWAKLVKSGRMTEQKFYEKYNAWKNHASHGNCIKLCHSMDLLVKELLEK